MSKERITLYFHCKKCLAALPAGVSPRDWSRINVGWTKEGVQVWCTRHDEAIIDLDFLGQKIGYYNPKGDK